MEDGSYAFYKNIIADWENREEEEPLFPFQFILEAITPTLLKHFVCEIEEIELNDAFVISYNETFFDTTVAKHLDPSDITVNVCFENSLDLEGSQILFYGRQEIKGCDEIQDDFVEDENHSGDDEPSSETIKTSSDIFKVSTKVGHCTIHYGYHPRKYKALRLLWFCANI